RDLRGAARPDPDRAGGAERRGPGAPGVLLPVGAAGPGHDLAQALRRPAHQPGRPVRLLLTALVRHGGRQPLGPVRALRALAGRPVRPGRRRGLQPPPLLMTLLSRYLLGRFLKAFAFCLALVSIL